MSMSTASRSFFRQLGMTSIILGLTFVFGTFFIYRTGGKTLSTVEAMDSAQIARNIAEGKGFTTDFIRPAALHFVEPSAGFPVVSQAPLYPLVLSGFFRWMGATDEAVILCPVILFLLTLPVVYLLALGLFGKREGSWALLLTAFNPILMEQAFSGTWTSPRSRPPRRPVRPPAAGGVPAGPNRRKPATGRPG